MILISIRIQIDLAYELYGTPDPMTAIYIYEINNYIYIYNTTHIFLSISYIIYIYISWQPSVQARSRSSSTSSVRYRPRQRSEKPGRDEVAAEAADPSSKKPEESKVEEEPADTAATEPQGDSTQGSGEASQAVSSDKKLPSQAAKTSQARQTKPRGGHRTNAQHQDRVQCQWCDRKIVDCPSGWAQHCSSVYCLTRRYRKQGYGNWEWCEWMAHQNTTREAAAWDTWLRGQQPPPEPPGPPPPRLRSNSGLRQQQSDRSHERRRRSRTVRRRRRRGSERLCGWSSP